MELLFISFRYRTRNDQWGTCIIDQYTIHLIHHGKMMFALHHFIFGMHHVITEVIKTKFVVGTIGDIAEICFTTFFTIRLMLIDTINSQA